MKQIIRFACISLLLSTIFIFKIFAQIPELILQRPHTGKIFYMDFNRSNGLLYTFCGKEKLVEAWNPKYGKLIKKMYVTCKNWGEIETAENEFYLSEDGKSFIVNDGTIHMYSDQGKKIDDSTLINKKVIDEFFTDSPTKDSISYYAQNSGRCFSITGRVKKKELSYKCYSKDLHFLFFDTRNSRVFFTNSRRRPSGHDTLYVADSKLEVINKIITSYQNGIDAVCTDDNGNVYMAGADQNQNEVISIWNFPDYKFRMMMPSIKTYNYQGTSTGLFDKKNNLYTYGINMNAKYWDFTKGKATVINETNNAVVFNDSVDLEQGDNMNGAIELKLYNTQTKALMSHVTAFLTPVDFFIQGKMINSHQLVLTTNFGTGTFLWDVNTNKITSVPSVSSGLGQIISLAGHNLIFKDIIGLGNLLVLNTKVSIAAQHPLSIKASLLDISSNDNYMAFVNESAWDGDKSPACTLTIKNKITQKNIFLSSFKFSGNCSKLLFSPNANFVALTSLSGLMVWKKTNNTYQFFYADTSDFPIIRDFCFNKNSTQLYYINAEKGIRAVSLADGKINHIYDGFTEQPEQILWSNEKIAVFESGNIIEILKTADLSYEFSLMDIGKDDWQVVLPNMYYTGSHDATKGVGFTIWPDYYTFDQFDLQYNRPDMVAEAMGCGDSIVKSYNDAYLKRLQRLNINYNSVGALKDIPTVSITNRDRLPASTAKNEVRLKFKLTANKSKIDKYYITVNNVPLSATNGYDVSLKDSISLSVNVPLSAGTNEIQVRCKNTNNIYSLEESVYTAYQPEQPLVSKTYFIGIGLSHYSDPSRSLNYAAKDITDLADSFKSAIHNCIVYTLTNDHATADSIRALKKRLLLTSTDDRVIIAACGHGLLDTNKNFYFAAYDCNFDAPAAGGVSYDELAGLLDNIPARKKLLLLDACQSGEIDKTTAPDGAGTTSKNNDRRIASRGVKWGGNSVGIQDVFALMQEQFSDLSSGNGAMIISAARGTQSANEGGGIPNGWFSYCVMQALNDEQADKNGDGKLSVNELKEYVNQKVMALSHGMQTPTARQDLMDYDWDLK